MKDFFVGVSYLPRGFSLLWEPRLRRFVVLPILVNVVVFGLLFWLGIEQFNDLLAWLLPDRARWAGDGIINSVMYFLISVLYWILWPVFILATVVLMFYTFTLVANLIGSPFNGMLAARVEMHVRGESLPEQEGSIAKEIWGSVTSELRKYLYFAMLAIPLLILFLVPVVNLIAGVLWAIFGAWALAIEYMDYPMGNHGMRFAAEREVLRRRRLLALGFGFAVLAMTLIPVVNLLAMPTAVIAGTLLWVDELKSSV